MLRDIPFIKSLHRPFNQELNTLRIVCEFVCKYEKDISSSSDLNKLFYPYLVKYLHNEYKELSSTLPNYNGLPSKLAIDKVYEILHEFNFNYLDYEILLKRREKDIDKQIYSTYKAASYYLNFARKTLKLIDKTNKLSKKGEELLNIRRVTFRKSSYDCKNEFKVSKVNFRLFGKSKKEKEFYFRLLLKHDFLFLIVLCYFKKFKKKYSYKDYSDLQYEFLKAININIFDFKIRSLKNYNTVRSRWIEDLDILDTNYNIRKQYMNIIYNSNIYTKWFNILLSKLETFELENFKSKLKYIKTKEQFTSIYLRMIRERKHDMLFVNIYDIKKSMRISYESLNLFLCEFYEKERVKKNIYFSNIVNSIDARKRFYVRGVPVIKIKIN